MTDQVEDSYPGKGRIENRMLLVARKCNQVVREHKIRKFWYWY